MRFTDCPECGVELKEKNCEAHVREKHPEEYMGHYPDAPERGWIPCNECWEWFHTDEEVTFTFHRNDRKAYTETMPEFHYHVANDHTEKFGELLPSECLMCHLGYFEPKWPPLEDDDEEANFIWRSGEVDYEAAAMLLSDRHGCELTEEEVREHDHAHNQTIVSTEKLQSIKFHMGDALDRPTKIEKSVMDEVEEGEVLTAKELAERCGYTPDGIRKRADEMVDNGILEVEDDTRPTTYRATGESKWADRESNNDWQHEDPVEVPDDIKMKEDFEDRYGHPPEYGGMI